jgi:hypothetical protein
MYKENTGLAGIPPVLSGSSSLDWVTYLLQALKGVMGLINFNRCRRRWAITHFGPFLLSAIHFQLWYGGAMGEGERGGN